MSVQRLELRLGHTKEKKEKPLFLRICGRKAFCLTGAYP